MMHGFELSAFEIKSAISNNSADVSFPSYIGEHHREQTVFPLRIGEASEIKFLSSVSDPEIKNHAEINDKEMKEDTHSIKEKLNSAESIKNMITDHPLKEDLWMKWIKETNSLNDTNASPFEKRYAAEKLSAQGKMNHLQGQIFETATKDVLESKGFDVEQKQRILEGETGGTRPDVIAKNNTDELKTAFGITVQPGQTISIECKCGGSSYMTNQLHNHIPNQLSGQEGIRILLTTSDMDRVPHSLVEGICDKYDAKLAVVDIRADEIKNAIMGVANI